MAGPGVWGFALLSCSGQASPMYFTFRLLLEWVQAAFSGVRGFCSFCSFSLKQRQTCCDRYAAFYKWLQHGLGADAVLHFGMHGTVEWLPGNPLGT